MTDASERVIRAEDLRAGDVVTAGVLDWPAFQVTSEPDRKRTLAGPDWVVMYTTFQLGPLWLSADHEITVESHAQNEEA